MALRYAVNNDIRKALAQRAAQSAAQKAAQMGAEKGASEAGASDSVINGGGTDGSASSPAVSAKSHNTHGLRHHFAVTLANSGKFTLDVLAEMLTHKSTAMTKRYGQFLPDTLRKAGNCAMELLQPGCKG